MADKVKAKDRMAVRRTRKVDELTKDQRTVRALGLDLEQVRIRQGQIQHQFEVLNARLEALNAQEALLEQQFNAAADTAGLK